jgi:hypothetical protein
LTYKERLLTVKALFGVKNQMRGWRKASASAGPRDSPRRQQEELDDIIRISTLE